MTDDATRARYLLGDRTMANARRSKLFGNEPSDKPVIPPPLPHTDEINTFFPPEPEQATIDFGDGVEVTLPPVVETPKQWFQLANELSAFWSSVKGYMARYAHGGDANAFVHKVLNVDSLKNLPDGSVKSEVITRVYDAIKQHARSRVDVQLRNIGLTPDAAGFKKATGYNTLEDMLNDGAHFSDVLATIEKYEQPPKEQAMTEQIFATPRSELETATPMHTESPVVIYPKRDGGVFYRGIAYSVTMREGATAEQALHLLKEWARFFELGAQYGVVHESERPNTVMQPPAQPVSQGLPELQYAPVQTQQQGGVAECKLITVGTSFNGGKPQLQFTCKGMDKPLAFTQPIEKMAALLANVRQSDGQPFHVGLMVVGNMFSGTWRVNWHRSTPNAEGKSYNNIDSVVPA